MQGFRREGTDRAPTIRFDYVNHVLELRGESYPEDVSAYYRPMFKSLEEYFRTKAPKSLRMEIELIYFNSSSARVLMRLLDMLDRFAAGGRDVLVNWRHRPDDELIRETGEEFAEDLANLRFVLCETA
jgi:hypothetical protein